MNVPQYGGGNQPQTLHHQEVAQIQQYPTQNSEAVGALGDANVHYPYPSGNSQPNQFSNAPLAAKLQTNDISTQPHISCIPQFSLRSTQQNTEARQPYNLPNPVPRKVDASTMTDRETQVTDGFFDCKPSYPTWQSLAGPPGSTVAEYLSRLPASTLPLTLHHFLKFASAASNDQSPSSGLTIKKEEAGTIMAKRKKKRKYKKKPYIPRPPRPKPGEIRLTTALDGSTLYCCPECHMAYPERQLLEQHIVVHRLERRFVCDICGAGLKRKEHLDRHKQGHNPERPYTCSVCMKAFKRNEHLSRHFVIHSGDKSQVCTECGKGFYRKDHLRKHAQSHIAKRLRAELLGQKASQNGSGNEGIGSLNSVATSASIAGVALMPGGAAVPILS